MKLGQITHQGKELWLRCPHCGDSHKNPNKAHFAINLASGLFHCLRCKASGRLSLSQLLDLSHYEEIWLSLKTSEETPWYLVADMLQHGPGSTRQSGLYRYHLETEKGLLDGFMLRDPKDGLEVGICTRGKKYSRVYGEKGFDWPYQGPVQSSLNNPLRLVEGPYDTLGPNDVACFGTLGTHTYKHFPGHSLILCPDGDVWSDWHLRHSFLTSVSRLMKSPFSYLVGIEFLPDNLDPDEVDIEDRILIPRADIYKLLAKYNKDNNKARLYA